MNIGKITERIYDKAQSGARYNGMRSALGKKFELRGKRRRLKGGVVIQYYEVNNGPIVYEVFEQHKRVLSIVDSDEKTTVTQTSQGNWIYKLGLEDSDIEPDKPKTLEEQEIEGMIWTLIDNLHMLARRKGTHFDTTEGTVRSVGRLYEREGLRGRLMRLETNGRSSPRFVDIVYNGTPIITAELGNDYRRFGFYDGQNVAELLESLIHSHTKFDEMPEIIIYIK